MIRLIAAHRLPKDGFIGVEELGLLMAKKIR
jgi:hypothetical protein